MIRLIIADDHGIVRSGIKQLIEHVPDLRVVDEAASGTEVMQLVRLDGFDMLMLDLNMPGINGTDLIQRIRQQRPDLPLLVLSMHNEPQIAARALKAGAWGYVTKDSEPDVLITAIRKVASGGRYVAPELASRMLFGEDAEAAEVPHKLLSAREMQIFLMLVAGQGVNAIAEQLCISNKTVSTHKTRLMEKLQLDTTAALVRYAISHGLTP